MNRWARTAAIAILAASASIATQSASKAQTHPATDAQPPGPPANPMEKFAWLIGGTWTVDVSKTMPGMLRIETVYTNSDNGAFIRFNTHFVSTKGTLKNYDGNLYYDSTAKTYRMWYADFSGTVTEGPMTIEGDRWQMDFTGTDFQDKQAELHVQVDRKSPNLYHWSLSEKAGEIWKPLLSLDYQRM